MATRHYCDVCGKESRMANDLFKVNKDVNVSGLSFDICLTCSEKMFKPVKQWHSMCKIEISFNAKEEEITE